MKKLRKNSFFGIHFDFHALEGEVVARNYMPETVEELLDRVKPDFVQCDTKGHAGFSSYPTQVGTQAYEIKEDILKMWRTATEKRDIALYAHHSGLYDMQAAKQHPEWAVKDEYGNISNEYMSPFSPYADEILIPQLKEIAVKYRLDGAWVDGDCWGAMVDYNEYAVQKYFELSGKKAQVRGDSDYEDYRDFCRRGFLEYVRHYINEVKKVVPEFQMTSNWIFSAYMPVEPSVGVDFLSGDYDTENSVASARYQGRCVANRNMPWELMSWGQNAIPCSWKTENRNTKEYVQYCQEAAEIISLGGAYVFFNIMYGGGGCVQKWAIPIWEKVAQFVREREEVCFKAEPYNEIAVLYPEEKTPPESEKLYDNTYDGFKSVCAWIDAIQNIQLSCGVLNEYQLNTETLNTYKILIIPNSQFISKASADIISEYIKSGGKVITDIKSVKYFSNIIKAEPGKIENRLIFLDGGNALAALNTEVTDSIPRNVDVSGKYYDENYYNGNGHTASFTAKYGKGRLLCMCFDFSGSYKDNVSTAIEIFLRKQLEIMNFNPQIRVLNSHFVDVVLTKKNHNLLINLINYSGPHMVKRVRSYGEIPPLYDIEICISTEKPVKKIYSEPGHKECDFEVKDNKIFLKVEELKVHKTIVAEGIC